MQAVCANDAAAVSALIAKGVDVNTANKDGDTLLMQSCYLSSVEIVQMLVLAGANMHVQNRYNFDTPLIVAAQMQREDVIVLFASCGAHGKHILSQQWQEHGSNAAFIDLVKPYIEKMQCRVQLRTQLIRGLLERAWLMPKDISRLICFFSDTEWYDEPA